LIQSLYGPPILGGPRRMNPSLTDLFELQKVDSALRLATRRLKALDEGAAERSAAETARELHERLSRTFHDTSGDLKDAELEVQGVDKKRKDFESKLYGGSVQNPKELQSIQQEIEALGRQKEKLDEKIIALMDQVETRRKEEADSKAQRESTEAAHTTKQAEWKKASAALNKEIKKLTAQRDQLAKPIPPAMMKRYDAFRTAKQGVGIARIEGNLCGACHTNLPSNLIRRVKDSDSIELCENCGRMLCIEG